MKPFVAAVVAMTAIVSLLAGCTTPPEPDSRVAVATREPDWAVRAIFGDADPDATGRIPDHDHRNRTLHQGLSTPNFELVGHVELNSTYYGRPGGAAFCGDAAAPGERQLAVVDSHTTDVGLTVIDVTDRAAPVLLGELILPYVQTYDSAIFADGKYAVIASNPDLASDTMPTEAGVAFTPMWRTACGTQAIGSNVDRIPYGYSAILVDLSDPANPTVVDFMPYAGGRNVHSISTAMIGGTRWVASSGLGALPCTVPGVTGNPAPPLPVPCQPVPRFGNLMSHYDFLQVVETPAGPRLQTFAIYTPTDQSHMDPSLLYLSNGHTDATIELHPNTNQTIAYMADWDGGLHIARLDPADAAAPAGSPGKVTPLATWGAAPGDDPTQNTGNVHSVRPVDGLQNGHHYLIVGQEVIGSPGARPSGQIVLLDVTDATHPIPRARWTLPVDVLWPGSMGLTFSTHYAILVDEVLYVAAYHTGVWAVDARMENWPDLPSLGVYLPDIFPSSTPVALGNSPEVLEVLDLGDGTVLAFDVDSGAYILRFHPEDQSVPPALPWPETAYIG